MNAAMKIIAYGSLIFGCQAQLMNPDVGRACGMLTQVFQNRTQDSTYGSNCEDLAVSHAESISGGYCLASMTAAGYYRTSAINPISELILGLSGSMPPVITATNSGGTMFIVRYFAFRDMPVSNKWTFPCYLLPSEYRSVCYFHGNFGVVSEECYAENQNIVGVATGLIYGNLIMTNGGPLGVVASYCSVYFNFLSNLPIGPEVQQLLPFWEQKAHFNTRLGIPGAWVAALTMVNPNEASQGAQSYNYGFDSYLSRGMNAHHTTDWYSNMTVYTVSAISANTLSGLSMMPFSFSGKSWDNSDDVLGAASVYKMNGLVLGFIMIKKMMASKTVLMTTLAPKCEGGCPILDGCFTDNGPITPTLAAASEMDEPSRPREISLLAPSNTMDSIKYLMGTGPLGIWTASGLNLCPFTQVSICRVLTTMRELIVPTMEYDLASQYRAIGSHYQVFRPNQMVMMPHCADPLIFDHFSSLCKADSICHMMSAVKPGEATGIRYTISSHVFLLSMVWLAPTNIAQRFVTQYIPDEMRAMQYYADMTMWFPDFVAIAPQKGGVGFTKVAGHSILDYLTYLIMRLTETEIEQRMEAFKLTQGVTPPCGYAIYEGTKKFTDFSGQKW